MGSRVEKCVDKLHSAVFGSAGVSMTGEASFMTFHNWLPKGLKEGNNPNEENADPSNQPASIIYTRL